jgi:chromosomal replication initiator protein DnaA
MNRSVSVRFIIGENQARPQAARQASRRRQAGQAASGEAGQAAGGKAGQAANDDEEERIFDERAGNSLDATGEVAASGMLPDRSMRVKITGQGTNGNGSAQNGMALNSRYAFENFVVGASNRLAHAASLAVAERPAQAYNPLFLYGGVGLGKTHLLHAIGNMCIRRGQQVLYVSSEEFTNDLIHAIRTHTTQAFRDKWRLTLLIDDIQFISKSTQEEFFHTFIAARQKSGWWLARPAGRLVTLEEQLRSPNGYGRHPTAQFRARLAILRSKAERARRNVPGEMLAWWQRVQSNIRELKALARIRRSPI